MNQTSRVPLRPDYGATQRRAAALIPQAAIAFLLAASRTGNPADIVRTEFRNEPDLALQVKAASAPASMTDSNWASVFATQAAPAFLGGLGPAAAFSYLLNSSVRYTTDTASASINVVDLLGDATAASYVGELAAIPVRMLAIGGNVISSKKLSSISVYSRETLNHSIPSVETTVGLGLTENTLLAADTAMLDAGAGTATRPPGLRYGIPALAGVSANPVKSEAIQEDLVLIASTLASLAGNGAITLICAPAQGWALNLLDLDLPFTVLISSSIAPGQIIGLVDRALVTLVDPSVRISVATEGTLHMDSVPSQISVAGVPNVVSAKVIDLWAQDLIALKVTYGAAWGLRNPAALCWIENVTW